MFLKELWKNHKVTLIVGPIALAFMIATIVLGIKVSELNSRLANLEKARTQQKQPWEQEVRLPTDVLPQSYNLFLQPYIESGEFWGFVSIRLNITVNRSWIAVHQKFLNIVFTELLDASSNISQNILHLHNYTEHEFFVLEMARPLLPGEYVLNMKFGGTLTRGIVGFYRSSYVENGIKSEDLSVTISPLEASSLTVGEAVSLQWLHVYERAQKELRPYSKPLKET